MINDINSPPTFIERCKAIRDAIKGIAAQVMELHITLSYRHLEDGSAIQGGRSCYDTTTVGCGPQDVRKQQHFFPYNETLAALRRIAVAAGYVLSVRPEGGYYLAHAASGGGAGFGTLDALAGFLAGHTSRNHSWVSMEHQRNA